MEESKQNSLPKTNNNNLKSQLKKIEEMQRSIANLQEHLRYMSKKQTDEDKKTNQILATSIKVTSNRIRNAQNHLKNTSTIEEKQNQRKNRSNYVRELREKQVANLERTRKEIYEFKQNQRNIIRNLSQQNVKMIHKMKGEQQMKNREAAKQRRQTHHDRMQSYKFHIKMQQKMKEEYRLEKSFEKISAKQKLQNQYTKLKEKQKKIQENLQKKRKVQVQIKDETNTIKKMSFTKISELSKEYQGRNSLHASRIELEEEEVEKIIFEQALNKTKR